MLRRLIQMKITHQDSRSLDVIDSPLILLFCLESRVVAIREQLCRPHWQTDVANGGVFAVVATIGSATRKESVLNEMFEAGMTAARFDLSFGDLSYHCQSLDLVHDAATKANRLCSMILDLGEKECQVVQPSRVDENGWHQCTQRIRIQRGQHVALTASGDLYIPEVRAMTLTLYRE